MLDAYILSPYNAHEARSYLTKCVTFYYEVRINSVLTASRVPEPTVVHFVKVFQQKANFIGTKLRLSKNESSTS